MQRGLKSPSRPTGAASPQAGSGIPSGERWARPRGLFLAVIAGVMVGAGNFGLGAASPQDLTDGFYDPAVVQTIRLDIAPEDLERMHQALPKRICVPGTFRWNDVTVPLVGIRYKGNSSSAPQSPYKRSFLIAFGEYRRGLRFLGLRHVALDNGIQFGGLFSERLITDILRGVGVKASRCNYARVILNGQPAGVYVNVERIDRTFLERHFGSATGTLFKVDEGGPGADLRFQGNDPARYQKAFELHAGREPGAFAELIEFIRAVDSPSRTAGELDQWLEVDAFLKTTAVLLFAGAFDQYTGWGPHNYYLYRNPGDRRWTYIPWDLDVGFADNAFGRIPVLAGWHAGWPAPVPGRPLMERLVGDPGLLERYRQHARGILETWFRPEVILPKLRALFAQVGPVLAEDPYPARRVTVPTDSGIEDVLASMEDFIRKRYALAKEQLEQPGARPASHPVGSGAPEEGPRPGPPSADAPTDLRAVKVSAKGVELAWVDHAEGEMAFIVQRAGGAEATGFVNAIGQGGRDLTTATDRNVRPGLTYRYRVYAVLPTPNGPRGTGVSNEITVSVPEEERGKD